MPPGLQVDEANTTDYDYSTRGELLRVTLPDGRIIEYVNDPLGRRIAKRVDGTTVEKYFWQGLTRLLAVYDGNDNLIMRFEYGDGRMPTAMTQGGATYYLTYDQVGSLRLVVDASGNVVKRVYHDSFGNIIIDTNPSFVIPFGFAGGLQDQDTGLVRFGHRDYDPDTGRWTAKDPILFAGGDTDLYGYCLANPVNLYDEDGRIPPGAVAVAVMGTGLAAWAINWWYDTTHPPDDSDRLCPDEARPDYPGSPGMPRNFPPYEPPPPSPPAAAASAR